MSGRVSGRASVGHPSHTHTYVSRHAGLLEGRRVNMVADVVYVRYRKPGSESDHL